MKRFEIERRGEKSWWVTATALDDAGHPLPFSRVVFFARRREEALNWTEHASGTTKPVRQGTTHTTG